ncbi:hypothetical protein ACIP5Y_40980 [Nocardia sp. NPDC088792]|uniref:hypothetical protein n=1 Tax=Nocardia sp. NPDC088792 TaxID=3364332 RepID=UPI0037F13013
MVEEFCSRDSYVAASFAQAATWTGLSIPELYEGKLAGGNDTRLSHGQGTVGRVTQAALVFGIHDSLAARGRQPDAVGGASLGAMIAACLAGAAERRELFELVHHQRLAPPLPPTAPTQGMAVAVLDGRANRAEYYENRPGVYLSVDHGPVFDGTRQVLVLAGYLDALEQLAAEAPPEAVRILPGYSGAFHTPLQQHVVDFIRPYVTAMTFHPPKLPLCSAERTGLVSTVEEVRDSFLYNEITPIAVAPLVTQLARLGIRYVIELGPGLPRGISLDPMISVRVASPDDLLQLDKLEA